MHKSVSSSGCADWLLNDELQLGNISVFYKQKSNLFYPVTSYSLPSTLLRIPLSAVSALLWAAMTYFVVGFAPDAGR